MSGLRVGIVTPGWTAPDSPDGLPALADLVRDLATRHSLRLVTLRYPSAPMGYRVDGVAVHALGGGTRAGAIGRPWLAARAVACLRRLHTQQPFDLLHGLWADEPGAVAVMAGTLLRVPCVVSVLGGELVGDTAIGYGASLGLGGRASTAVSLRWAAALTVGSNALGAVVRARTGVPVHLVPLGVDLRRFKPGPETPGAGSRILWVGSLEPVKDPVTALRAFARVAAERPTATLTMVGEGSLRPALERLADRLRVAHRVRFEGHVARTKLPERYRAADVLLVTSRHEAQSMVAVEAAACGLPVVGTRVGALVDLDSGAVTVEVGDHAPLAWALGDVLDDPARRHAMGRAGRAVAEAAYDLTTQAQRLETIHYELATPR